MTATHANAYYAATRNNTRNRPKLCDRLETDVCIAGGGFSGVSAALHLAEAGFRVVPLEAARLGFGASGRNGGQLVNSYSLDIDVIERNYKLDYLRVTADNRLLYGGGDPASIERYIRGHLEKTFPQLEGVAFDYTWGGDFLLTLSRLPQFGRLTPEVYYVQGYSGHGVTTTHLAGRLVAEALQGQAERFDA